MLGREVTTISGQKVTFLFVFAAKLHFLQLQ